MNRHCFISLLMSLSLAFFVTFPIIAQEITPDESINNSIDPNDACYFTEPSLMLKNWLLKQIDQKQIEWQQRYESLKTIPEIEQYQQERIDYFWKQLGTLWEKTPLNPQITGTVEKEGYRVEKIVFESLPQFYVTGTFFLPDQNKYQPPYPGMLVVCGHSDEGKAYELYQGICELAAYYGIAAFIIDPIDQGERFQHLDKDGKPYLKGVPAHNLVGSGSILLGRNAATFEVWDMTRALDYMQSRADIIPNRLGVAGNSGGGTQSSYIMALDERIAVAAPACYLCNLFDNLTHQLGPQDAEQNIFGQIGFGMDHADYCIMRAPKPTLMCVATQDFFNIDDAWESFRYAKRIFSRWTLAEQMAIIEKDAPHGYGKELRETTVRWMLRWLAGRDELINEPENLEKLTLNEIRSIEEISVLALPNARTTYDLNRDLAKTFQENRRSIWKEMTAEKAADLLRNVAGIRTLKELPTAELVPAEMIQKLSTDQSRNGCVFQTDQGIFIPVRSNFDLTIPSNENGTNSDSSATIEKITLIVSDQGRFDEKINPYFEQETESNALSPVLALDLRGWGETQGKGQNYYNFDYFGPDGSEYYLAYLLGKSYVGMRTDDLLSITCFLKNKYRCPIDLTAFGLAGNIALHAKIAEPSLFESVKIERNALPTWDSLVEKSPTPIPLSNAIHGVLEYYDVDNLMDVVQPDFLDE